MFVYTLLAIFIISELFDSGSKIRVYCIDATTLYLAFIIRNLS
jgi:hypothetical protein